QRSKAPAFMVSGRPPNSVRKAFPVQIPARYSPLEKTPHKARVIRDGSLSATITLLDMPAERSRTAGDNGAQHFQVQSGQPTGMLFYESCAIGPNNVGHLQRRPNHFSEGFLVKFKLSRGLAVART